MKRLMRGAGWLLGLACAATVSCADSPMALDHGRDDLDPVAAHAAASGASARGQLSSLASGQPAHANGGSNVAPDSGQAASAGDACGTSAAGVAADSTFEEPAPADVCAIARYLPNTQGPGRQMVSASIDHTGGSLRLGDFEIIVPAGAVDRPTRFAIVLPPPGHGDRAYAEFLPHNQQFAAPVTIRLPHAGTDAGAGAPVAWWSRNGKAWVDQPTAPTADGRIETQVDHFSFYGTRARSGITIAGG